MTGRRALVTGAGGFVGRHLVEALLADGWHVTALDRAFDAALLDSWRPHAARLTLLQRDAAELPDAPAEALVHAAALTASPDELGLTPEEYVRASLDPMLAALAWAAERGARCLVLSSSAVFRESAPGPLGEDAPPTPLGLYAVAKAAAEALAETLYVEHGRDVAAVRLSSIYGPGEMARFTRPRTSPVARLIAEALEKGRLSVYRADPARDWTYAPDIGAAIAGLLNAPELHYALYNLASGQMRTPLQIAEAITAALPNVHMDAQDGTNPALPPLTRFGVLTNQRLTDDTGYTAWTPFETGITATVRWMQAQMETAS
jgi:nucleoside-diphosphate-sugar epimerase